MSERAFFDYLLLTWFVLAAALFFVLFRTTAPYGRHGRSGWGPSMGTRIGWLVMEAPASLLFFVWFLAGGVAQSATLVVFFLMWQAHYLHRAFIYPFSLDQAGVHMPLAVVAMGVGFNSVNTYLNGRYLFTFSGGYATEWMLDPRFMAGVALFVAGYVLNRYADHTLRMERIRTGARYCRIDNGIFRYVCCPNYLGELIMWSGWAVATWSLAGLSFAVWTAANLLPRGRSHLAWSRTHLHAYPEKRKAVIPGLW